MTIQFRKALLSTTIAFGLLFGNSVFAQDVTEQVEHRYADNGGVNLHYARMGSGPLLVLIHGFPDFWYTWRNQMGPLAEHYTVVAMDTRGYNLSDQPQGIENYVLDILVSDVAAVVEAEGESSAIIVGHDWGGGIAWSVAAMRPDITEQLIILNLPHPANLVRELAKFGQQHENSIYARNFQQPDYHENITGDALATGLARGDADLFEKYSEAFGRSNIESMMNYYRANYPRDPYTSGAFLELPEVQAPVLQFHGLLDTALLAEGVNSTWEHLAENWTLMTIPGVNHFPHHERPELVTQMMLAWLNVQRSPR